MGTSLKLESYPIAYLELLEKLLTYCRSTGKDYTVPCSYKRAMALRLQLFGLMKALETSGPAQYRDPNHPDYTSFRGLALKGTQKGLQVWLREGAHPDQKPENDLVVISERALADLEKKTPQ